MRSLILLLLLSISTPALAIYKCEFSGKVVYSDQPCKKGEPKELKLAPPLSDSEDAQQRLARDKQQLQELETSRKKQEGIEEKQRQKVFKKHQALKKKCALLAQKMKWANEDLESASFKSRDKMQKNARRAHEKYQLTCSN